MSAHDEFKYETALADAALRMVDRDPPGGAAMRKRLLDMLRAGYPLLSDEDRHHLREARPGRELSPHVAERLERLLGIVGLHRWAEDKHGRALEALGEEGRLGHWLTQPPFAPDRKLLRAGLKAGLGIATESDNRTIRAQLGPELRGVSMADKYQFDPRGLPPGFDENDFKDLVRGWLDETVPDLSEPMVDFVLGAMSLDGFLGQDPATQRRHVRDLRFESELSTKRLDKKTDLMNRHAYPLVDAAIEAERAHQKQPIGYYEELAFVARRLLGNAVESPIEAPGLQQRVSALLTEYVAPDAGGTLNIPSLSDSQTGEADLVPENIRAVALVYAAWNLEELKLFQVLDRVVEVFMAGQLPVGYDNGGRALADYYFDDDDKRLTEAARRMTYGRVLGVPGGEVSKEAPPNRAFQDLLLRFMASVSEYDRQRRIDDVVGVRARIDVLSNTGEQVRKAGFDLAANASLYGYGGTYFVAQRLAKQIERALRILSVPEILSAYGVQSPFQVIERVCASDLGGAVPNVVQRRTMAEAGKTIIDVVASFTAIWPGSSQPLFGDSTDPVVARTSNPDIPQPVQDRLGRAVEQWLAVNGIKDEQRAQLGEPQVATPVPSIPTTAPNGGGPAFDQIKQMISAGQTPSIDQLKALMPDVGGMVRM